MSSLCKQAHTLKSYVKNENSWPGQDLSGMSESLPQLVVAEHYFYFIIQHKYILMRKAVRLALLTF